MKAGERRDIILEEDNGEIEARRYFFKFSPSGFKTDISASTIGWLHVSLPKKVCDPIVTP